MRPTSHSAARARGQRGRLTIARRALGRRAATIAALAAAATNCVPASRYHEPRAAFAGPGTPSGSPDAEATASSLAGDWAGQYDAPLYGRRGALRLSLRRVPRATDGSVASTVTGTATLSHEATPIGIAVDSARVGRGRVVVYLAPFADPVSGATVRVRLDGALAGDTLGGRLRADGAATAAAERRGGWRLVRTARPTPSEVAAPAP
jgi:hypothetical protein